MRIPRWGILTIGFCQFKYAAIEYDGGGGIIQKLNVSLWLASLTLVFALVFVFVFLLIIVLVFVFVFQVGVCNGAFLQGGRQEQLAVPVGRLELPSWQSALVFYCQYSVLFTVLSTASWQSALVFDCQHSVPFTVLSTASWQSALVYYCQYSLV